MFSYSSLRGWWSGVLALTLCYGLLKPIQAEETPPTPPTVTAPASSGNIANAAEEAVPPLNLPGGSVAPTVSNERPATPSEPVIISEANRPARLDTVFELFQRGGWAMWMILVTVIIGLAFFFERIVDLRRRRHTPKDFEKDLVHVVDTRGVDLGLALCLDKPSSLSRVLYAAMLRYGNSRQDLENSVKDEVRRMHYDLRRNGRFVLLMALLAPALGVLAFAAGTLSALESGHSLAPHIATSLYPLCFGLGVLPIFMLLFAYTRFKADDLAREIEEKAIDALVSLDRKAKRSIRQIEDIEEALETKTMPAAKDPFSPIKTTGLPEAPKKAEPKEKMPEPKPVESSADLLLPWNIDAEMLNDDIETSIKTGVATPAHPVVLQVSTNPHGSAARLAVAAANAGKGSGLFRLAKPAPPEPLPPVVAKEPVAEAPKNS